MEGVLVIVRKLFLKCVVTQVVQNCLAKSQGRVEGVAFQKRVATVLKNLAE